MNIKKEIDWDDAIEYLRGAPAALCDGFLARITWEDGVPTFTHTNTRGIYRHKAVQRDTVTLESRASDSIMLLCFNTVDPDNRAQGITSVVPLRAVTYEPNDVTYDMEACASITLPEGEELDPELIRRTLLTRVRDMDSAELQESVTEYDEI